MSSIFQTFMGADGQTYWRVVDPGNHQTIAVGGQGFASEWGVAKSIDNFLGEMAKFLEAEGRVTINSDSENQLKEDNEEAEAEDGQEEGQERAEQGAGGEEAGNEEPQEERYYQKRW